MVVKYSLSHRVGVPVHAPSSPEEIVSGPFPVPKVFNQPRPTASTGAPSGAGPTYLLGSPAP